MTRDPPRLGPPVELPDDTAAWRDMLIEARERGATPTRLGWGVAAVCDLIVAELDRRRALDDDEVEGLIAAFRLWCVEDGFDEAAFAGRLDAWRPVVMDTGRGELASLLAVKSLLDWCLTFSREETDARYGRSWSFVDAMRDARLSLIAGGEDDREARGMVKHAFVRGLAEEVQDVPSERELARAMERAGLDLSMAYGRRDNPARVRAKREPVETATPLTGDVSVTIWRQVDNFDLVARDDEGFKIGYLLVRRLPEVSRRCAADVARLARRLGGRAVRHGPARGRGAIRRRPRARRMRALRRDIGDGAAGVGLRRAPRSRHVRRFRALLVGWSSSCRPRAAQGQPGKGAKRRAGAAC